jgi:HEAT repeat protein
MFQLKSRFISVVIISTLITLPFLLTIPFIPNAHAGNVNELIQDLNEPSEACNAAKALADLKTSEAVEPLIEAIKQNKDRRIRHCAAEALAKIGDMRSVDLLVASLKDEDLLTASRATYSLGYLKDKRAVKPLLLALTEYNIPCPAAEALGMIKDPSSVEPLIEALNHENVGVRGCAAIALGMFGDHRACKPLIKSFMHDSDSGNQDRARRALEMIGCSFKEHAREYRIEDNLCNTGQGMIDFISSNMEKYPDHKSFSKSEEWKNFFSEVMVELNRLNSNNPEAGKKLYSVIFLAIDWAGSIDSFRKLSQSSDKNQEKIFLNTAVERIKDKEISLKVICPEIKIPDYTQ